MDTFVALPAARDLATARAAAPLAADRSIRCGPFAVPFAVQAATPTLEQQDSAEAAVLRRFLADDPWSGMGSVHPGGWLLLGRDADTIVVGQREHEVGLGPVVTLERRDGRFTATRMGGWQLILEHPSERAEVAGPARSDGTAVVIDWTCGTSADGLPDRVCARVELDQGPDEVHFLLVSVPNPDLAPADGPTWSHAVGTGTSTTVELAQPLGDRALINDRRLPVERLVVRDG